MSEFGEEEFEDEAEEEEEEAVTGEVLVELLML